MTTATAIPESALDVTPRTGKVRSVVDQLLAHNAGQVEAIAVEQLHWNPDNPRTDAGDVVDMAATIAAIGVLEPLLVAHAEAMQLASDRLPLIGAGEFIVIAGHRRLEAAKLAGVKTVPCIVRDDLVGEHADVAMVVENVHREDLTPIEEARSYLRLQDVHGKSQRDIAALVGRNQSHISKRLQLLALPEKMHAKVGTDELSVDEALVIAKHADKPSVLKAIEKRSSYQSVEQVVRTAVEKDSKDKKVAAAKEKLRKQGVTNFVKYDEYGQRADSKPRPLKYLAEQGVDVDAHIHSECHAVAVGFGNWGTELHTVPVCTKPESHPESGDTKRNEQEDRAAAKRAREKQLDAKRHEGRLAAIAGATAKAIAADTEQVAQAIALRVLLESSFDVSDFDGLLAVLGIEVDLTEKDDHGTVIGELSYWERNDAVTAAVLDYANGSAAALKRAFVAAVLVDQESNHFNGEPGRIFLEWLPKHGYKLSAGESTRLRELSK